ncbi:MAG: NfeD family protein, partial [Planctomycetota bacterium]
MWRFWAWVCCLLMVVCVLLELLTPSMGGFTFAALGMAGGSIYLGFRSSEFLGYLMIAANLALFPLSLWLGVHLMRRSPLKNKQELNAGSQSSPDAPPLTRLAGQQGRALTPLRPGGAVLIGNERIDAITEGKFVEADTLVKVI